MTELLEHTIATPTGPGDHDTFSHYARKTEIERSVFDGVEITALCGKKWRPSRDFTQFPVCPTCKEIFNDDQRILGSDL